MADHDMLCVLSFQDQVVQQKFGKVQCGQS